MSDTDISRADASTVLNSAETYVANQDYQAAYDLLFPLLERQELHGANYGRASLHLGDACWGLGSNDAALGYYEAAVQHAAGEYRSRAEQRVQEINHYDAAVDADGDGLSGEREGATALRAADEAIDRHDFETAWYYYSHAYSGIQMTNAQVSHAAFGMAKCYLQQGDAAQAAAYLDVAEGRDPAPIRDRIAELRQQIVRYSAGATLEQGGVETGELRAMNLAAGAAFEAGNYEAAFNYFRQMYESPGISGTERGRVAGNMGSCCFHTHDYDAARQYLEIGRDTGSARIAEHARANLAALDNADRSSAIVATIIAEEEQ